ncbi:hypothetical protein O9929_03030 [Vibrio lentus]|nr:hypothetical protein [Vibrio lentus]
MLGYNECYTVVALFNETITGAKAQTTGYQYRYRALLFGFNPGCSGDRRHDFAAARSWLGGLKTVAVLLNSGPPLVTPDKIVLFVTTLRIFIFLALFASLNMVALTNGCGSKILCLSYIIAWHCTACLVQPFFIIKLPRILLCSIETQLMFCSPA